MNAAAIAYALNGRKTGHGWLVRCPVHEDHDPSLSIADGENGRLLVKCFAGCEARDILSVLQKIGLSGTDSRVSYERSTAKLSVAKDWSPKAEYIWGVSVPLLGTPAEKYLRIRGCAVPHDVDLRFLPARGEKDYPTMVARITDILEGTSLSLHFTHLLPDGSGKAPIEQPKRLLGGHRKARGVIRLMDDADVTMGLGIAEGIETALACTAMGWQPVWAALDTGNMANFPVLPGIECLTIFADHDSAGIKAARKCVERWRKAGKEALIIPPSTSGSDWADVTGKANA